MIRECEEHGYFRDERCPYCGEEGKFLMSDYEVEKLGRSLAGILRHRKNDPDMDSQGYVSIREVLNIVKARNSRMDWLRTRHIEALVETDPKGRYMIVGGKIKATYGHTVQLDLVLDNEDVPEFLYYPATPEEAGFLEESGIYPSDRAMVHLSLTYGDAYKAGSVRVDDPVVLEVDTDVCIDMGYDIGKAARTVFLCKHVPPEAISVADPDDYEEERG
ncbi:MAG: RNA 2'-phosphotransferase [Candidatus Methanomethylophilaceae archaeon]|nr:RNA 2'-phosphotransferase [Candidatus Methanomethylophilaceae archaeon]